MRMRMVPLVAAALVAAACAREADDSLDTVEPGAEGAVITGEDMVSPPAEPAPVVLPSVDTAAHTDTTATDTPAH